MLRKIGFSHFQSFMSIVLRNTEELFLHESNERKCQDLEM